MASIIPIGMSFWGRQNPESKERLVKVTFPEQMIDQRRAELERAMRNIDLALARHNLPVDANRPQLSDVLIDDEQAGNLQMVAEYVDYGPSKDTLLDKVMQRSDRLSDEVPNDSVAAARQRVIEALNSSVEGEAA